jgi:hypothetical protein
MTQDPVDVAIELRRRIARDALLDPFGWVGLAVVALVLSRLASDHSQGDPVRVGAVVLAALGVLATVAHRTADFLLFELRENDFLRVQPIGPRGLLTVRTHELGWWSVAPRILGAACGYGAAGLPGAIALAVAGTALNGAGIRAAIALRRRFEARGPKLGGIGALGAAVVLVAVPPGGLADATPTVAAVLVAGLVAVPAYLFGRGAASTFDRSYAGAASAAARAERLTSSRLWPFLERTIPLPPALRVRVVRDLVLLARGWDGRGLFLLMLSPLAGYFLVGELQGHLRPDALLWRVLQAAALGGAAVAYAAGPGVHTLRNDDMVWERTAPHPGRRASLAAHAYAAGFAILHSGGILAVAALADGGRHAPLVAWATPAVLAVELAMAHYTVAYAMTRTTGRRVAGEATLAFALPVVAVAVAGASLVHPTLGLVYFVLTAAMFARGVRRYEAVEVTW